MLKHVQLSDTYKLPSKKAELQLKDLFPAVYDKIVSNKTLHDANFAFVSSTLAKLHTETYSPLWWTTYQQDIPIDVGGGFVDFIEYFTVNWTGIQNAQSNLTGNNATIIPRINANLNQATARVYTYQIAYDLSFVELEKLETVRFQKNIQEIYQEAIRAGFDLFTQVVAYTGAEGTGDKGLFNNPNVKVFIVPDGASTESKFSGLTDVEIVSFFNGVMVEYLTETNWNLGLLPDTFLLPSDDAKVLSDRFSDLFTKNLRNFLLENNFGVDEARANEIPVEAYKFRIKGRPQLDELGTNSTGRIVVYRKEKRFVRMDMPYALQLHYTGPNVERAAYTSIFVGQISAIQLPYNDGEAGEFGPVTYWDFGTD